MEHVLGLAVGNGRLAWSVDTGGNTVDNIVFAADAARPSTVDVVYRSVHCCRAVPADLPDQDRVGPVFGRGSLLVFATSQKCGDPGTDPCAAGTKPSVVARRVWRIVGSPPRARCLGLKTGCAPLTATDPTLELIAADKTHIALRRPGGALVVADAAGQVVRTYASLGAAGTQLLLSDNAVIALTDVNLQAFSIGTGKRLATEHVTGPQPRLVDASRGLVAYLAAGKLHLLRLTDGFDRAVATATDARFDDDGLVYSYDGASPWPGRLRFVPWTSLPLHP